MDKLLLILVLVVILIAAIVFVFDIQYIVALAAMGVGAIVAYVARGNLPATIVGALLVVGGLVYAAVIASGPMLHL